jgi:hypothetical protein
MSSYLITLLSFYWHFSHMLIFSLKHLYIYKLIKSVLENDLKIKQRKGEFIIGTTEIKYT